MTEPQPNEPKASTEADAEALAPRVSVGAPPPDGGAAQRDVDLMYARVESLREEVRSLNRTLLILGVVAAIACLIAIAGLTKARAAKSEAVKVTRVLRQMKAKIKKMSSTLASQPRRVVPIASPTEPPENDRSHEIMMRELGQLRRLVGSAPAQQAEVEASFVAWGQEVRQYVDDALVQASEGHRRERIDELRPVFQRLLEIEERLDR